MKWYQLHLSTLLAVTMLAGVFVWLNVRTYPSGFLCWNSRGWPLAYCKEWDEQKCGALSQRSYSLESPVPVSTTTSAVLLDVLFCLLLLALVGAGLEWLTRRMRRGNANQEPS